MSKLKKIILSAMFLALLVVLSRFLSISTPIVKITFSFVATMLCAVWLGPVYAVIVAGLGDLIGAYLFPFGSFFLGYTLSAILTGLVYGLLLYKKTSDTYTNWQFILRLIISTVIVNLIINGVLNTFWIYITLGKSFWLIAPVRIVKNLVFIPIQVVMIFFLEKVLQKTADKYLRD